MSVGVGPITQYWHDARPPEEVATLLESFRRQNPGMRHLLFSEASAEEFIVRHFTSREAMAFRACRVPAMQADYLRYCAVFHHGGVYADADLHCVAPLASLLEEAGGGVVFGVSQLPKPWRFPPYEWRERIGPYRMMVNDIFAFPAPRHPLLELSIEAATANIEHRVDQNVSLVTGPVVFGSLYLLRELGSFDAFRSYTKGGAIEHIAPLLCEVVDDYLRIERAFAGVRLEYQSKSRAWARPPRRPPAYKKTDLYWANQTSSIFRP